MPVVTILVPGPWREVGTLLQALRRAGIDARAHERARPITGGEVVVELVEDAALGEAFKYGRTDPLPDALRARVTASTTAVVIDIGLRVDRDQLAIARIGRALRDAGGHAVRMEASGGASPWEPWLAAFESGSIARIYDAAVVVVAGVDATFTCGMHQFDRPDAEIRADPAEQAVRWLDAFHIFQLVDDPALASGHTFRPDARERRRALDRWPDARHDTMDGRHNPFGVWRLCDPAVAPRPSSSLAITITPPLVAILTAKERAAGRPLTRAEVEHLVATSPAIALPLHEARALERARGYADIDPERAWVEWQIVSG